MNAQFNRSFPKVRVDADVLKKNPPLPQSVIEMREPIVRCKFCGEILPRVPGRAKRSICQNCNDKRKRAAYTKRALKKAGEDRSPKTREIHEVQCVICRENFKAKNRNKKTCDKAYCLAERSRRYNRAQSDVTRTTFMDHIRRPLSEHTDRPPVEF